MTDDTPWPFYITVETDLPAYRDLVATTFFEFFRLTGIDIPRRYLGAGPWCGGDYSSTAWYLDQATDPARRQVNANVLLELYDQEPHQRIPGHHELVLIERDLFIPGTNFLFGVTRPHHSNDGYRWGNRISRDGMVRGTIQSTLRPRRSYGRAWMHAMKGLLIHELGHFYGLPDSGHTDYIDAHDTRATTPLEVGHCNRRDCIMEQINVPRRLDLLSKVQHVTRVNPNWFCQADLDALRDNVRRMYTGGPNVRTP